MQFLRGLPTSIAADAGRQELVVILQSALTAEEAKQREVNLIEETTEPLRNGQKLPDHPSDTTALKIVKFGAVRDDADGTPLQSGLHQNEIRMLQMGQQMSLGHLYRYAILDGRIFHTRDLVVIDVCCVEA